jgi:hypothetical protein
MAIGVNTVWRVRAGGNDANGAGYDSTISGAATDYTKQDAAQLSLSDVACSSNTTVTSTTGGFTSAMIGNAIRITGGGATSGYYFITAVGSLTSITVDRTPGAVTNGTGKVGGAAATWQRVANNSSSAGDKCVGGNTVFIRGAGSDTPTSNDYTFTGSTVSPAGDSTNSYVKFVGENGRPRLQGDGLMWSNCSWCWWENLYITTSSNTSGTSGMISANGNCVIKNLVVNTNNQTSMAGLSATNSNVVIYDTEVFATTGTPSTSASSYGILASSYALRVVGCHIHNCRNTGIQDASGGAGVIVQDCLIHDNSVDGVALAGTTVNPIVRNCTIDSNAGNGISVLTSASLSTAEIRNNIISNHTVAGKKGLVISSGTTALNDKIKSLCDYNCYYNNTAHFGSISAGTHDTVDVDPLYVDRVNGNYAIGINLKALGWPGSFRNNNTSGYFDPGCAQRKETTKVRFRLGSQA